MVDNLSKLNELMAKKKENDEVNKEEFNKRVKEAKRKALILWLFATVALGFIFVYFQAEEYKHAIYDLGITFSSGIYGSTFYLLTGFHGFHVTMGAVMLSVIMFRSIKGHFSKKDHFAFEAVAWYWHFVDVVWLGLFIFVYWI